jgi:hypothetical protein
MHQPPRCLVVGTVERGSEAWVMAMIDLKTLLSPGVSDVHAALRDDESDRFRVRAATTEPVEVRQELEAQFDRRNEADQGCAPRE